ncbi:hypothetical protein FNH13_08940 [Ornithinimicrobium ciconiae]|uniref:Exo-alpha-sialidase n=1 Tax=Ornithinimicrobium ciconiae TaxID=2594265 RepID=A0A516GAN7_9MICO|nr:hypothetical protein [Ornithinimicrobium ciconiae]QDO88450.1 hypothetical protein FNH13_08940 [Ornithinimicrobium ciconiae]
MSSDEQRPGDDGRPGEARHDPVEEFFAAHRAQVRDEPADEVTWQRIRDGRRRASSPRRGAVAGAIVAAAAALAVVFGPGLLPDAAPPDLAGPPPGSTEPASGDPSGPEQPQTVTTEIPEGTLASDGRFADVTTADPDPGVDTGVRRAVVTRPCDTNGWCSVLATSDDGGLTWAPSADLAELGMVDRVLFVDHERGWVWGGKAPLWATVDGGRSWTQVDVGGDTVDDISVWEDVLLATTLVDDPGTCTSAADCPQVSGAAVLTDPADRDWTDDPVTALGPVGRAAVIGAGNERYVLAHGDGALVTSLLRLQDGRLESTAAVSSCGGGPVAVTASADDPAHLWALCDDERGLALQQSSNGARTWLPTNLTVPSFVLGERAPLMASTHADHLLLVGEGNYALTTDGGQTWSTEEFLPGAQARPERLEVTMFGEVIAYPTADQASPELALWRSGDGGRTWETVLSGG